MNKSLVYSWRLSSATKTALEEEARRENVSLAELLDRIAHEWLEGRRLDVDGEVEQERIRARAMKAVGALHGGDPTRSSRVRELVRERLARRRS